MRGLIQDLDEQHVRGYRFTFETLCDRPSRETGEVLRGGGMSAGEESALVRPADTARPRRATEAQAGCQSWRFFMSSAVIKQVVESI